MLLLYFGSHVKGEGDISLCGLNSFLLDAYVFLHVGKDI